MSLRPGGGPPNTVIALILASVLVLIAVFTTKGYLTREPETILEQEPLFTAGTNGLHIHFILDESSAMSNIQDVTIQNFNKFLLEQRLSHALDSSDHNEPVVSLTKFGAPHLIPVYESQPLRSAPLLSTESYQPHGGTNLLDAVGNVIQRMDKLLQSQPVMEERPGMLIVIATDGRENSSTKFTDAAVKSLIEARKEIGWTFVFLGANIDTWDTAAE
jgi:hypothetical protein